MLIIYQENGFTTMIKDGNLFCNMICEWKCERCYRGKKVLKELKKQKEAGWK